MKRSIVIVLLIFTIQSVFANTPTIENGSTVKISGRVLDSKTNEPLPFANIIYTNTGTTTNLDGEFIFTINYNSPQNTLLIKFIGYESASISLSENNTNLEVKMSPTTKILDEILIHTADQVLQDVNNHRPMNYEFDDQVLSSYYKESVSTNSDCYYLAEGILDIYYPTVFSDEKASVHPQKTRKKEFASFDTLQIPTFHGHASDMINGITRRHDSFINQNHLQNYSFMKEGLTNYDGRELFKITFTPKNKKGKYQGTLYIDTESKAIIRAEYYPNITHQNFWTQVKWVEEYKEIEGTWYIHRVSYNGQWQENGKNMTYSTLLVVTGYKSHSSKPKLTNSSLSNKDSFIEEASAFSDNFWEGFNFVKLNLKEIEAISGVY